MLTLTVNTVANTIERRLVDPLIPDVTEVLLVTIVHVVNPMLMSNVVQVVHARTTREDYTVSSMFFLLTGPSV